MIFTAKPNELLHYLVCLIAALSLSFSAIICAQQASDIDGAAGQGYIDSLVFDGTRISAQGWAATENPGQQITTIKIALNGTTVYNGPFERFQRPDVANSFDRPQWLGSGWRLSFDLPEETETGSLDVLAQALTREGKWITLAASPTAQKLDVPRAHKAEKKRVFWIKAVISCSLIFLALSFLYASRLTHWLNEKLNIRLSEPLVFTACVLMVASLFVGVGLTGSALRLGQPNAPFIQMDVTNILARDQAIRSDEWLVMTPLSIAQYNHEPRFPIVNRNIGEDGQNMLIIGMGGAPVAHISALAKPATWGFFLFDLRRALSWNWCFAIFGCFLALSFVFNSLSPRNWRYGFVFSGLFCCTPYVAAWSYWPAYTVFFPSVIFICVLQILKCSSAYTLLLLATALGLASAGFVLILYPAWQVSVGYVFMALIIGIIIRDKLYNRLTPRRIAAYVVALSAAGLILAAWWIDANTAIHTMQHTVYPGQRFTTGGGYTSFLLLRGFTNISTLMELNSPFSNQSEMASFYYFLLPLLALFLLQALQRTLTSLEWALAVIIGFILIYMFFGIPPALSQYSLWSNVPSQRADLALGLGSLILSYLLLMREPHSAEITSAKKLFAISFSLAWAYIIYRSINQLDRSLLSGLNPSIVLAILITTAAISYCLITQKMKPFMYLSFALAFSTTASFNPVNIAPNTVKTRILTNDGTVVPGDFIIGKKVLVLENTITAMFLAAAGMSVINGVLYYPQTSLWQRLDPDNKSSIVYNRYQHLTFLTTTTLAPSFTIGTPRDDVIAVSINVKTFDFRLSGANVILTPDTNDSALLGNEHLSPIMSANGWSWFSVKSF